MDSKGFVLSYTDIEKMLNLYPVQLFAS